jgi:methyl-accepting chemotaxis protein
VETLATGSGEMGDAIRAISQTATAASEVATEAVGLVRQTVGSMEKLGTSSEEIGNVVQVITAIAQQTNLLALNATIEASRAGDSGRGFAVVATEVKELALETARATEDIARRVKAIQSDTLESVQAINRISDIIQRIHDHEMTISAAVEEQTATTIEMDRHVVEAADRTREITGNIEVLTSTVLAAADDSRTADAAVRELVATAAQLHSQVRRFKA